MSLISTLSPTSGALEFIWTQLLPPLANAASWIGKAVLSGGSSGAHMASSGAKAFAAALMTPHGAAAAIGAALVIGGAYLVAQSLSRQIERDMQKAFQEAF